MTGKKGCKKIVFFSCFREFLLRQEDKKGEPGERRKKSYVILTNKTHEWCVLFFVCLHMHMRKRKNILEEKKNVESQQK